MPHDLLEFVAAEITHSDAADFAHLLNFKQSVHGIFERSGGIGPVDLVKIDVIDPESLQTIVDFLQYAPGTRVAADSFLVVPFQAALGGDDDFFTPPLLKRLPDYFLGFSETVNRRGIDEIYSQFERSQNGGKRFPFV
jgi:hypothetical protein